MENLLEPCSDEETDIDYFRYKLSRTTDPTQQAKLEQHIRILEEDAHKIYHERQLLEKN